jgi:chromosome segregation ATPase
VCHGKTGFGAAHDLLYWLRMKKAKKKITPNERLPDRSSELLVNQRMLYAVRDELKSDIRSHEKRFDSIDQKLESHDKRFDSIEKRFESVDKRFEAIDKRFDSVDKRFDSLDAKIDGMAEKILSEIHRMRSLVEEQNNRNIAVIDGYQS